MVIEEIPLGKTSVHTNIRYNSFRQTNMRFYRSKEIEEHNKQTKIKIHERVKPPRLTTKQIILVDLYKESK